MRVQVDPRLMEQCVKNLVFVGRAMHLNPELCFDAAEDAEGVEGEAVQSGDDDENLERAEEGQSGAGEEEEDGDEKETGISDGAAGDDAAKDSTISSSTTITSSVNNDSSSNNADPLRWVFNRMSNMVVHKGEARRRAVFSWFAAMAALHEPAVSTAHLRLMLLPLRRAVLDAEAGGVEPKAGVSMGGGVCSAGSGGSGKEQTSAELATEVWHGLARGSEGEGGPEGGGLVTKCCRECCDHGFRWVRRSFFVWGRAFFAGGVKKPTRDCLKNILFCCITRLHCFL